MEVKNCRGCGRLYNYIGGGYLLCPACMSELDKQFDKVKRYVRDNPHSTMPQIAEANDVKMSQIERWVREERLTFSDDSPIGIECENCGATIKTGRFCGQCKDSMTKGLAYQPETTFEVQTRKTADRDKARMRFLDK